MEEQVFTHLDRIFDAIQDYFDELDGFDVDAGSDLMTHQLASQEILQLRIACAFWRFGDGRRALQLGFPSDPARQAKLLAESAGDKPAWFVGTYTLDDETSQTSRQALCLRQAQEEIRYYLHRKFGAKAILIQVALAPYEVSPFE
jgi:hypothetical protein